jgi:hypothetical protein
MNSLKIYSTIILRKVIDSIHYRAMSYQSKRIKEPLLLFTQ